MSAIGPGDFVECVDDTPDRLHAMPPHTLKTGAVYVVERIWPNVVDERDGKVLACLDLVGVPRYGHNYAYGLHRFRPIYRPKASLIEGLLKPIAEDAGLSERAPTRAAETVAEGLG